MVESGNMALAFNKGRQRVLFGFYLTIMKIVLLILQFTQQLNHRWWIFGCRDREVGGGLLAQSTQIGNFCNLGTLVSWKLGKTGLQFLPTQF